MTLPRTSQALQGLARPHPRDRRAALVHLSRITPVVFLASILVALLPASPVAGQELLDEISILTEENAQAYAAPLTEGLAYALSGGFTDRSVPLEGMRFDIGVRVLGARPGEGSGTFQALLPDSALFEGRTFQDPYRPQDGSLETPSIAGSGDGIVLVPDGEFRSYLQDQGVDPDQVRLAFPGGLDLPLTPLLALHGTLGIGMGSEVSVRFLPAFEAVPELGSFRSHGFSVSHHLSRWFTSPIDLTATAGYQKASSEDFFESSALHYGLTGGLRAGPMDFYGGALLRSGSTRVDYQIEVGGDVPGLPADGTRLTFESDVSTETGYLLGARLQLLALNLSGHYTFGEQDVVSLKLGMGVP